MWEPGKHTYRLLCLILALVGLMIGAPLAPEPAGRVSAQVVGPDWSVTGSLNKARVGHTATLLRNGKVLVAGGHRDPITGRATAEIYDPATGKWTETGSLNTPRLGHIATLLADGRPGGRAGLPAVIRNRDSQSKFALFGQSQFRTRTPEGGTGEVSFAGAQGAFVRLDQINALALRSLAGRGEVDILLVVDSQPSNSAQTSIK